MNNEPIAFIGLGNMGLPMANNLANAGYSVQAYDANPQALGNSDTTIQATNSIAECVSGAHLVFTMLPNGSIVLDVLSEILDFCKKPTVIVDCSTIDINDARKAHTVTAESGHVFFDSPVSGGVAGAAAGTLTAMIGGDKTRLDDLAPYMKPLFSNTIYCGEAGSGQAAKLCNNMLLATTMIGVSESFNLASSLGLSATTLFSILSTSTGSCWSVNNYCPVEGVGPESPADRQFKPGFSAAMMLKDMKLTQNAAHDSQVNTPLGAHALELYQRYVDQGGGAEDFSGIVRFLQSYDSNQK
jgi:3-hydroxyisobutyrate dehydrogenase